MPKNPSGPILAFAVGVAFWAPALASEAGLPLGDCSDWVITEPGITCTELIPYPCTDAQGVEEPMCGFAELASADNESGIFVSRTIGLSGGPCNEGAGLCCRHELWRAHVDPARQKRIAYIDERCYGAGQQDLIGYVYKFFAREDGRLYVLVEDTCEPYGCYQRGDRLLVFSPFTTEFEILQTYTPQSTLSFRVPSMPEGLRAADHFDTYWGRLAVRIDFGQAQPLQCAYPAAAPASGDSLSVTDTLPTPPAGEGYYYVTAVTYQGETRYGRQNIGGVLSGRDPASLPACL